MPFSSTPLRMAGYAGRVSPVQTGRTYQPQSQDDDSAIQIDAPQRPQLGSQGQGSYPGQSLAEAMTQAGIDPKTGDQQQPNRPPQHLDQSELDPSMIGQKPKTYDDHFNEALQTHLNAIKNTFSSASPEMFQSLNEKAFDKAAAHADMMTSGKIEQGQERADAAKMNATTARRRADTYADAVKSADNLRKIGLIPNLQARTAKTQQETADLPAMDQAKISHLMAMNEVEAAQALNINTRTIEDPEQRRVQELAILKGIDYKDKMAQLKEIEVGVQSGKLSVAQAEEQRKLIVAEGAEASKQYDPRWFWQRIGPGRQASPAETAAGTALGGLQGLSGSQALTNPPPTPGAQQPGVQAGQPINPQDVATRAAALTASQRQPRPVITNRRTGMPVNLQPGDLPAGVPPGSQQVDLGHFPAQPGAPQATQAAPPATAPQQAGPGAPQGAQQTGQAAIGGQNDAIPMANGFSPEDIQEARLALDDPSTDPKMRAQYQKLLSGGLRKRRR